jgi:hypothetical protein
MSMHYFTTTVVNQSSSRTEVLEEQELHFVWPLPYVLPDMGGSTRRLRSRQHSSSGHSTIPNNFILFRVPKDLFLKLSTYFFYSCAVGQRVDGFLCRCKMQNTMFVLFREDNCSGWRWVTVFVIKWNIFNMQDTSMLLVDNTVPCRPAVRQRPRDKQQWPLLGSGFQQRTFPFLWVPELPPCLSYQLLRATAHND